jgi:hypothetical protein
MAMATAVAMLSGHSALAAQLFVGGGFYFIWRLFMYPRLQLITRNTAMTIAIIGGAWLLGIALSMPQNLPTYEYLQSSNRIQNLAAGQTVYSPQGLVSIPLLIIWFGAVIVFSRRIAAPKH